MGVMTGGNIQLAGWGVMSLIPKHYGLWWHYEL